MRYASLAALLLAALPACSLMKPDPIAVCRQRRDLLDGLYRAYPGGSLKQLTDGGRAGGSPSGAPEVLVGTISNYDQARFEEICATVGAGGRLDASDPPARDYFSRTDVIDTCRRAVDLMSQVQQANSALPPERRSTCR